MGQRLLHPLGALQGGDDGGQSLSHVPRPINHLITAVEWSYGNLPPPLQRLDVHLSHHHHAPICHPTCIERATATAQPAVMTYFSSCQRASRRMRQKGASWRARATNSSSQSPHRRGGGGGGGGLGGRSARGTSPFIQVTSSMAAWLGSGGGIRPEPVHSECRRSLPSWRRAMRRSHTGQVARFISRPPPGSRPSPSPRRGARR